MGARNKQSRNETEISLSYPPAHSQYPRYPDPTTALLSSTVHQSCATRQPSCCSPKVSCIHFKTQFQIHPYSIRASKRTSDFEASNLIEHFPPAGQHPQTTAWRELLDESGCLSSRSRENSFPRASILSAAF